MILEVQHETQLDYTDSVTELITEVRMEPVSDPDQSCRSFHVAVIPATELGRYQDGMGNRVHHFNLLLGHEAVRILAASVVETHPRQRDLFASKVTWPFDLDAVDLEARGFLGFGGPVRPSPRLTPVLQKLQPRHGIVLAQLVFEVAHYIRTHYEYARDVTLASSPIDDLLEQGKGVCQDFTHLMIAILRSFDVPVRYVSGYLHRPGHESQSHAWCEVWLPDLGWLGIDPTNNRVTDEHFIKVAIGRDFTDVPPNKGVYKGNAKESIHVRVETRALDRLPSLSWQEQLPPLHVPLKSIIARPRYDVRHVEESEQQQQ